MTTLVQITANCGENQRVKITTSDKTDRDVFVGDGEEQQVYVHSGKAITIEEVAIEEVADNTTPDYGDNQAEASE